MWEQPWRLKHSRSLKLAQQWCAMREGLWMHLLQKQAEQACATEGSV